MNKNNIIDITLPNKRTFSIPLTNSPEIYGSTIIDYLNKFKLKNYVICRNTGDGIYDVLYSDTPNEKITPLIKISKPFSKSKMTEVIFPARNISSAFQRIPLFVFYIKSYLEILEINSLKIKPLQALNHNFISSSSIKVQLSTGLIVSIDINITDKIEQISNIIYKKMEDIYKKKRIKDFKEYRFGTYDGYYPSMKTNNKFEDEPLLMEAYKLQQIKKYTPQFLYLQTWSTKQPFDKVTDSFTKELDLSCAFHTEETRILNSSLSIVRRKVEEKRIARLESNPLLARMRISDCEPPLPKEEEVNQEEKEADELDENGEKKEKKKKERFINVKAELKSAKITGKTTGLSIRVPYNDKITANDVIKMFFDRLTSINHADLSPEKEIIEKIDNEKDKKARNSSVALNQKQINDDILDVSEDDDSDDKKSRNKNEEIEDAKSFDLISNPTEVPIPPPEDDNEIEIKKTVETKEQNDVDKNDDDDDDNNDDRNPDDFAFVINGTDEVIAGDIPFLHFVCVRQFIVKQNNPILNLLLYKKKLIINKVKQKELKVNVDMPELPVEKLAVPITVKKPPKPSFETMSCCPHFDVQENLSINIRGVFNVNGIQTKKKKEDNECRTFVLSVTLINGTEKVGKTKSTRMVAGTSTILFNETIKLDISISSLPRTARIAFTLYMLSSLNKKKKKRPVGTYNFPVFTFSGWMNTGKFRKKMWKQKDTDVFLTTCESNEHESIRIAFQIPEFKYPVFFLSDSSFKKKIKTDSANGKFFMERKQTDCQAISMFAAVVSSDQMKPSSEPIKRSLAKRESIVLNPQAMIDRIGKLVQLDPLSKLKKSDKKILKENLNYCKKYPELLSLYLTTIDYTNPNEVKEIPDILNSWEPLSPELALSLLDAKYADQSIRSYAVERFELFTDNDIMLYLLQLVQALKYELYDDSPLARFLLKRGLNEPKFLGHQLFWQLMSEAHISHIRHRFSILLVNFMYGTGSYTSEFLKGYKFTQDLVNLNHRIRRSNLPYGDTMQQVFRNELKNIEIPNEFHLPIDPRIIVDSFIIDKCKVMNSKKKPFSLLFKNASPFDTDPPGMLFKVGDDLRQDQLTLQVMKVMEHLWRTNYKDMHMRCYGVLPTGFNQGFIEAVPNSVTEAELQAKKGTIAGVLEKKLFSDYFSANNPKATYDRVLENFRLSSAGYAVATCVLGVADRHPGNIMVQKDGHYFHIDFGHFLGNFKVKMGYKRENAPFHFSPACAYTLSEKDESSFASFEQDAGTVFNILRHNAKLLITLLMLMVGTGIPELSKPEDIQYMKDKLFLEMTDDEAAAEFKKLTKQSMDSTKTKLNNFFHNLKVNSA